MRRLLFRGQYRKLGEKVFLNGEKMEGTWVYGGICQGPGDHSIIYGYENAEQVGIDKFVVHTDTVGQYTGLTDKTSWAELTEAEQQFWLKDHTAEEWTGKPIFEGDIVEGHAYSSVRCGVIVWIDEIASFGIRYQQREDPTAWENASILKRLQWHKDYFAAKVVGSIYDDPELLCCYSAETSKPTQGQNADDTNACVCWNEDVEQSKRVCQFARSFLPSGWQLDYSALERGELFRKLWLTGICMNCGRKAQVGMYIPSELGGDTLLDYICTAFQKFRPFHVRREGQKSDVRDERCRWYQQQNLFSTAKFYRQFVELFHVADREMARTWLHEHHPGYLLYGGDKKIGGKK